jgi:hypothetical protein
LVNAVFRSTDVDRNASVDLQFIEYISRKLNRHFEWLCDEIEINITMNSAHIRKDIGDKK